jgi:hypothetical protein
MRTFFLCVSLCIGFFSPLQSNVIARSLTTQQKHSLIKRAKIAGYSLELLGAVFGTYLIHNDALEMIYNGPPAHRFKAVFTLGAFATVVLHSSYGLYTELKPLITPLLHAKKDTIH